jgi:carbamate kinase
MRPKVEAAIEFVRWTGKTATISRLDDAPALLTGDGGTVIAQAQVGLRLRDSLGPAT